ncbi:MAG: helix-turn-helix domain-containing protein [Clostridia bacterium]|nr:helix-turn-helix domain-containing protein [Clostridia bacterium]MDE7215619.1 helix-turn-helix domain-containing protein [Clostridia bacterium]MDE7336499.1 helix-turn-helix domain-containing protein [Clostridia bacterium]
MIKLDEIRSKLQFAIKHCGYNQSELARRLGIHYSAVSQYLSGRSMPALDTFANICVLLDLDANEILCVSDNIRIDK